MMIRLFLLIKIENIWIRFFSLELDEIQSDEN